MDRRAFITVVGGSILATPLVAETQQAGKVYRVGILWVEPDRVAQAATSPPIAADFDLFRQSLTDNGFVEGRNLLLLHRWSPDLGRFPDLATELIRLNVDVLFTADTPGIRAAAGATQTIPVVILSVGDPLESGLVASLARPGGNITGLSNRAPELSVKLLELLKECIPRASRIAVIGGTAVGRWRKEMEVAAPSMGTRLQFVELTNPQKEVDAAFETIAKARAEGLVLLPTIFFAKNPVRIARLALHHRLPAIFWERHFPAAGGLMAYGPDLPHLWQRAGVLVAKILRGAKPSDLPVEQADRFSLVINLQTAKALELAIPQSVLIRADKVIE
jgi:putative ABC transport system substrate-binding protein